MSHTILQAGLTVTPAGRYARVFFEMFDNSTEKEKAFDALKNIQSVLDAFPELKSWAMSAMPSLEDRYDVIASVSALYPQHSEILPFLRLLCENNRLSLLPAIIDVLDTLFLIDRKEVNVHITSAVSLSVKCQNQLEGIFRAYLSAHPKFFYHVDPSLLAGMVIRWGDQSVNLSVQTKISDFMMLIKGANHAA